MGKGKRRLLWFLAAACICSLLLAGTGAAARPEPRMLVPGGSVIGIQVECDGVLVAGIHDLEGENGSASPAFQAGVRAGDVITAVGARPVRSIEEFRAAAAGWDGGSLSFEVQREGETLSFSVLPAQDGEGQPAFGLWLRDGMAGIGTLSFYEPASGLFGALGHGVNDVDTGVLLPFRGGRVSRAAVSGAVAGQAGRPGELLGSFDLTAAEGRLERNTSCGIFGALEAGSGLAAGEALAAADKSEIRLGEATLLCGADGTCRPYTVEITRLYPGDRGGRDMLVTVTDPALLALTGGIIQGMSGSPLVQNGKLIGAVTHVLVNEPTQGYGISIETMLAAAE